MSHRFVRCPHCKMPHDAAERVCPTTGRRIESPSAGRQSRMSELPPPERRPEPLGFDPAKHRIAEREAAERASARAGELQRPATDGTLQPTRNLQTDLIGRTVSDRYIIRGVLGEGGMGTVYEAEHMGLGRQVAIKVLNPSQAKKRVAVKRFQQEARAAGAIGHPNICEVYDLGLLDDGSPYLVMEKLIGTTLADRISREGGLPFDEVADVMIQVLSGLIAAHDKGIVHRDIKPENIFLARRVGCPPIVKILDFGVSKMMPQFQGGEEQLDLTRTGMVMGTPYYMSPEQARGERNLDGRVDVYACGVMLYESIVGKRPFLAPNYNALLLAIINTVPKPIREVRPATPSSLEAIVTKMMAKARDDRYPTANAVLREIQALPVAAALQGARIPLPPSAEERTRAQQLGGSMAARAVAARGPDRGEREDPNRSTRGGGARPNRPPPGTEGAGATLQSRMAEKHPPTERDNATRLDIKVKGPHDVDSSGSIEIPIHITGSELEALPPPRRELGLGDEMPTEIFRPGKHPEPLGRPGAPHMASRSPSATRVMPPRDERDRVAPRAAGAPPPHADGPAPRGMLPDLSGLGGDDWEGETVVKKPAALTTAKRRENKPFVSPEETVNLKGDIDVEFADEAPFADETQFIVQPPRRPR